VGLLSHATGLYDDLTVTENVRFWARASQRRDSEGGHDVEGALVAAGVEPRVRDIALARLSTGQRRRASLAAFLVRRPQVWLLDEPHAGLDAEGRDLLDGLIRNAAAAGTTVLVASHELERSKQLATRSVLISGGSADPQEASRVA
jgi:ABC-type multidrug transport system ATPase subunit